MNFLKGFGVRPRAAPWDTLHSSSISSDEADRFNPTCHVRFHQLPSSAPTARARQVRFVNLCRPRRPRAANPRFPDVRAARARPLVRQPRAVGLQNDRVPTCAPVGLRQHALGVGVGVSRTTWGEGLGEGASRQRREGGGVFRSFGVQMAAFWGTSCRRSVSRASQRPRPTSAREPSHGQRWILWTKISSPNDRIGFWFVHNDLVDLSLAVGQNWPNLVPLF